MSQGLEYDIREKYSYELNEIHTKLNQIKDDSDIKNRVIALESSQANTRWFIGIGLTVLGLAIAWLSLKGGL